MDTTGSRVALVTGGGTGIGAACARLLAAEVEHVIIASQLPVAEMQPVCDAIIANGGSSSAETADLTDDTATRALVDRVVAKYGRIDSLVNAAGVFDMTPLFDTAIERVQRLLDVNFLGSFNAMNSVLPVMRAQGSGAIVNIASAAAIVGQGGFAAYAASKAAIVHFTRTIAPELARTSIRVNAVAPGPVRTAMTAMVHDPKTQEMAAALARMEATSPSPYGTAFMEPEDIAAVVIFLLSDAARAIHGTCVVADQGYSAAMPPL